MKLEDIDDPYRSIIRAVIGLQQTKGTLDLVYATLQLRGKFPRNITLLLLNDKLCRLLTIQICSLWTDKFLHRPDYKNSSVQQIKHTLSSPHLVSFTNLLSFLTESNTTTLLTQHEDNRNKQYAHISARDPSNIDPMWGTLEQLIQLTGITLKEYITLFQTTQPDTFSIESDGGNVSLHELLEVLEILTTMDGRCQRHVLDLQDLNWLDSNT